MEALHEVHVGVLGFETFPRLITAASLSSQTWDLSFIHCSLFCTHATPAHSRATHPQKPKAAQDRFDSGYQHLATVSCRALPAMADTARLPRLRTDFGLCSFRMCSQILRNHVLNRLRFATPAEDTEEDETEEPEFVPLPPPPNAVVSGTAGS